MNGSCSAKTEKSCNNLLNQRAQAGKVSQQGVGTLNKDNPLRNSDSKKQGKSS